MGSSTTTPLEHSPRRGPASAAGALACRGWCWWQRSMLPAWLAPVPALLLYAALTIWVLRHDFLEYNADGYARIIHGYEWLQAPRWEVGVWLPLQTWLFGAGLFVYDSLRVTPRLMDVVFSLVTLLNLYLIGRTLAGRAGGLLAALIGAGYPWLVWLGVSGMSEPLFHATLTAGCLGFARWTLDPRRRWLLLGALGMALSTMVRYEGWFYAALFAALVLWQARRAGRLERWTVALALLPFVFPLLWMEQHWQHNGDPFQFAADTANIKAVLDARNDQAGLLRRLIEYPRSTFRLAPRLTALCALAGAWGFYRHPRWRPYLLLVAGQGTLLVVISAGFSNLGPGAERYLLSNLLLLFPVLAGVTLLLPSRAWRAAGLALLVLAMLPLASTMLDPPTDYPDGATRAVAERARDVLASAPPADDPIPVLLPAEPAEGFYAGYALRILSGRPDEWRITSDPLVFDAWLSTTHPPIWIIDTTTGQALPPAERIEHLERFVIGFTPPRASAPYPTTVTGRP